MASEEHDHTFRLEAAFDQLIRELDRLKTEFKGATTESDKLDKQTKKTESGLAKLGKGVGVAAVGLNVLAAGAIAAGGAFGAMASDVFDTIDAMNTFAQTSGLSTERIGALRLAARAANKDLSAVVPKDFGKRMLEAANNTGEAARGFRTLGIDAAATQALLADPDGAMDLIIDRLFQVEDASVRAGLAMITLGESGGEFLSLLSSSDDLDRFVQNAEHFGINAGPASVEASNAWWNATANLQLAFENVGNLLATHIAPIATKFINDFSLGFVFITELVESTFDTVHERITEVGDALGRLVRGDITALGDIIDTPAEAADRLGDIIADAGKEAARFWSLNQREPPEAAKATRMVTREFVALETQIDDTGAALEEQIDLTYDWVSAISSVAMEGMSAQFGWRDAIAATSAEMMSEGAAWGDMIAELSEDMRDAVVLIRDSTIGAASDIGVAFQDVFTAMNEELQAQEDDWNEKYDNRSDRIKSLREEIREAREAGHEGRVEELQGELALAEQRKQTAADNLAAIDHQQAKKQAAAVAGFRLEQSAAVGEIAINSAIAFTALLAAMSYLGLSAPIAAGAIAFGSAAAQTASVLAQQPPSFHDGGLAPDEFTFSGGVARIGETPAVLNQRATELGGAEVVDQVNRGTMNSGPVKLVLMDAGRVIGEAWLQAANGPGQTGRDLRSAVGTGEVPRR